MGAAYGTAKSALGMIAMGVSKPNLIMKAIIPAIMAGIRAIYGLVVAVLIAAKSTFVRLRAGIFCVCMCVRVRVQSNSLSHT